tara:strand:+ start:2724 stop:3194 length:471 start_codon:yes stop_codon:yes gene_type:complete
MIVNIKKLYFFVFLISIFSILSAIYIEFVLGIKPCVLCLYQRVPYIVAIFICFLGYYNNSFFWIYFLFLIFLIGVFLSSYHLGIENNIFNEFSGCTSSDIKLTDKQELLKSLNSSRPNCKDVNFKIFGISLAAINLILSMLISALMIIVIKYEKNR